MYICIEIVLLKHAVVSDVKANGRPTAVTLRSSCLLQMVATVDTSAKRLSAVSCQRVKIISEKYR